MDHESTTGAPAGLFRRLAALLYDLLLVVALAFVATFAMLPLTQGEAILTATQGLVGHALPRSRCCSSCSPTSAGAGRAAARRSACGPGVSACDRRAAGDDRLGRALIALRARAWPSPGWPRSAPGTCGGPQASAATMPARWRSLAPLARSISPGSVRRGGAAACWIVAGRSAACERLPSACAGSRRRRRRPAAASAPRRPAAD